MQNKNLFKFPKARVPRSWFRQFNVVLLRIEGYTNAQIASIKGVTERAIERQFSRIRRAYKERYKHN